MNQLRNLCSAVRPITCVYASDLAEGVSSHHSLANTALCVTGLISKPPYSAITFKAGESVQSTPLVRSVNENRRRETKQGD